MTNITTAASVSERATAGQPRGIGKVLKLAKCAALSCCLSTMAAASGQIPCGNQKLVCLIPTVLHTTSSTFNFFNTAFGTQIAQLPMPSRASGFLFAFDKSLQVYAAHQTSFGPVLSERAETIGRHQVYFSTTYQRFSFSKIDNNDLKNLSILFYFPTLLQPQVVTNPSTRVAVQVDQYVASGTLGLTDKLDISAAVPFGRVSIGVTSRGTEFSTSTAATAGFAEHLPGAAAGVEDFALMVKRRVVNGEKFGVALGTEVRFPTGDAENYLGSGAYGLKPFVIASRRGRVTPHVDIAYQWNSHSILNTNQAGHRQLLPGLFTYNAGVDIGVTKRVTVVGDLLGQVFFNAPQVSKPRVVTLPIAGQNKTFTTIVQLNGTYNADNVAVGFKANPWNNLLITANATFKVNNSGLRATVVPLLGVSYSFNRP